MSIQFKGTRLRPRYRVSGGKHSIELKLQTPHQLFDERDPAPFWVRDLDDEAARYIIGSFRDLKGLGDAKLTLYLEAMGDFAGRTQEIADAIHAFFRYESEAKRRELREIFKQGVLSLVIGAMFLATCMTLAGARFSGAGSQLLSIFHEGLVIMGWVAMWKPISIFLYEWWPIYESLTVLRKLSRVEVEIFSATESRDPVIVTSIPGKERVISAFTRPLEGIAP